MIEITKQRFLELFSIGSQWTLVRCHFPIKPDLDYNRRVLAHKRSKIILQRISTGEESDFDFKPNQQFFHDGNAIEIHTHFEHDKTRTMRYEPLK